MNSAYSKEVYHVNKTYLEGWYSMEDLKRIIETAQRINEANVQMMEDFTQNKTSG
jgi:hypothetical protein